MEKLDDLLKTAGEQLIDYSNDSNSKFSAVKDQVNLRCCIKNLLKYLKHLKNNSVCSIDPLFIF